MNNLYIKGQFGFSDQNKNFSNLETKEPRYTSTQVEGFGIFVRYFSLELTMEKKYKYLLIKVIDISAPFFGSASYFKLTHDPKLLLMKLEEIKLLMLKVQEIFIVILLNFIHFKSMNYFLKYHLILQKYIMN